MSYGTTDNSEYQFDEDEDQREQQEDNNLVEEVVDGKMTWKEFLYRLFFTKGDDLDLGQIMFLLATIYFFVAFSLTGAQIWVVSVAAWSVFGAVFTTLSIAGTSTNVARLLANSKAVGDVADGIAKSGVEPNMYKDDERGSSTAREAVASSTFNSGS